MKVTAVDDDRTHRPAEYPPSLTACGLEAWIGEPDGPLCHVCFPADAHPLEAIWAACRRWDLDVNAQASRTNTRWCRSTSLAAEVSDPRGVGAPGGPADENTLTKRERRHG